MVQIQFSWFLSCMLNNSVIIWWFKTTLLSQGVWETPAAHSRCSILMVKSIERQFTTSSCPQKTTSHRSCIFFKKLDCQSKEEIVRVFVWSNKNTGAQRERGWRQSHRDCWQVKSNVATCDFLLSNTIQLELMAEC